MTCAENKNLQRIAGLLNKAELGLTPFSGHRVRRLLPSE